MSFEQNVPTVLRAAIPPIELPIDDIVAAGLHQGRKRRRRHRLIQIAEVSFALLLVSALAATSLTFLRQRSEVTAGGTPAPNASSFTAIPVPAPDALASTLAARLRTTGVISKTRSAKSPSGSVSANVTYNDGHGAAAISVAVIPRPTGAPLALAPNFRTEYACTSDTTQRCTIRPLPDGSLLSTGQYLAAGTPPHEWSAYHARTDGSIVAIEEWNSETLKGTVATRPWPPLNVAQITALATADW